MSFPRCFLFFHLSDKIIKKWEVQSSSGYIKSIGALALIFHVKDYLENVQRKKKALWKQTSKIKCNLKCFIGQGIYILPLKLPLIIDAIQG